MTDPTERGTNGWVAAQEFGHSRQKRLEALRDALEAFELEYGALDPAMVDEVHRRWPDVVTGGVYAERGQSSAVAATRECTECGGGHNLSEA